MTSKVFFAAWALVLVFTVEGNRTLMFFDDHPLDMRINVERRLGRAELIPESSYSDPAHDLCTNWGYPSVYRCNPPANDPLAVWCMMYEAQVCVHRPTGIN